MGSLDGRVAIVTGTSRGTTSAQLRKRLECVSSAPLGLPVVPEV